MIFQNWHTTILDRVALEQEICKFLRTHTNPDERLMEWMQSIPPDHTEAEHDRAWRSRTLQGVLPSRYIEVTSNG